MDRKTAIGLLASAFLLALVILVLIRRRRGSGPEPEGRRAAGRQMASSGAES